MLQIILYNQCFLGARHLLGGLAANCVFSLGLWSSERLWSSELLWCRRILSSVVPACPCIFIIVTGIAFITTQHLFWALCQKLKI